MAYYKTAEEALEAYKKGEISYDTKEMSDGEYEKTVKEKYCMTVEEYEAKCEDPRN